MSNKFTVRLSILTILFCSTHFQKIEAAEIGNLDAVKRLCEERANVNAKDKWGETALNHASFNKHEEIVQLLKKNSPLERKNS